MLSSPRSNGILHVSGANISAAIMECRQTFYSPEAMHCSGLTYSTPVHTGIHSYCRILTHSPQGNSYGNIHDCRWLLGFSTCTASCVEHLLCRAAIRMGITRPAHWGAVEMRSVHGGWTTMLSTFSTFKKNCSQSLLYIGVHSLSSRRSPSTVRQKSWQKIRQSLHFLSSCGFQKCHPIPFTPKNLKAEAKMLEGRSKWGALVTTSFIIGHTFAPLWIPVGVTESPPQLKIASGSYSNGSMVAWKAKCAFICPAWHTNSWSLKT